MATFPPNMSNLDPCKRIRQLMDAKSMEASLDDIASKILQDYPDPSNLLVMGMASRGIPLAERIAQRLSVKSGQKIPVGNLDATFYRDDFHYRKRMQNPALKISAMPRSVEDVDIILVDDVLFTGRTIRAALQSLMDMGRPRTIRLAVLLDRGLRELPIAPDYVGMSVKTGPSEEIRVQIPPMDSENAVWLVEVEAP